MSDTSPPSQVTVRPAQVADAPAVASLAGDLGYPRSVDKVAHFLVRTQELAALAANDVRGAAVVPTQAVLVAVLDGKVIGWIEAATVHHLQYDPFALIGGLVVADSARSQGVGRMLCRAVEQWARNQGVRSMRVTSRSTRRRAHQFYLRDGYVRVKTSEVFEKLFDLPAR